MASSEEYSNNVKMIPLALIWLDPHVTDHTNKDAEKSFRENFGRFRLSTNVQDCKKMIQQSSEDAKLVLIVSGQFGSELVPLIHDRSNVKSIYVYCLWKEKHEEWARKYQKVKAVITTADELVQKIREDNSNS